MSERSSSSYTEHSGSQQSRNETIHMNQDENTPPTSTAAAPPSPVATGTPPSPIATGTPPSPPLTLPTPQKTPRRSRKRPAAGTPARTSPAKRTATLKPKPQAPGTPPSLSEDDSRLVKLRQEGKAWQEISEIFDKEGRGKVAKGSLAKRYSRLMVKLTVWEENEVGFLLQAIADVDASKWEHVSAKLLELAGASSKKFSAAMCEHKAKELAASSRSASMSEFADTKASEEDN